MGAEAALILAQRSAGLYDVVAGWRLLHNRRRIRQGVDRSCGDQRKCPFGADVGSGRQ
ncbi:hypothetical protein ACETU7_11660 [Rhodococcus sp. 3Y1]